MDDAAPLSDADLALADLLRRLDDDGYDFVPPTPLSHQRVIARPGRQVGRSVRDILGWSLPFDRDAAPSIPVGFTSARWGSLASFGAQRYGTKKLYGYSGNSFVAVVEFGPKVRAVAVTAGGESGHPGDRHFNDQAERYATGQLREVYFWPEQLKGHTERSYRPGD